MLQGGLVFVCPDQSQEFKRGLPYPQPDHFADREGRLVHYVENITVAAT